MQRTKFVGEFGPLVYKSTAVFYLNLIQVENNIVVFSKTQFIEMPVMDSIFNDPVDLAQTEGPTLNKGIISLKSCLESLSGKTS